MTAHPPADGQHTRNGTPHGFTSLTPHLVVSPAEKAIEFYQQVFGAKLLDVTRMGNVIAHAALALQSGCFTLSDPMDGYGLVAPTGSAVSMSLTLYVPNVDAVVAKAVEGGATLREPVATFVSGDRYGSILDPFGVRWSVMTRVEDLSAEESNRRVADWAAKQRQTG